MRQALTFHDLGARRVVITRGELGVVSVSDELRVKLGTYPISFVDGSGGGDAFNAGYIVGLLEGRSELDCLKLASAVGASCVRSVGTTAGVFTARKPRISSGRHELTDRADRLTRVVQMVEQASKCRDQISTIQSDHPRPVYISSWRVAALTSWSRTCRARSIGFATDRRLRADGRFRRAATSNRA